MQAPDNRQAKAAIQRILSGAARPIGPQNGMLSPGNVDLYARPRAKNPDGSISTVRSITITDPNGVATLLPTVSPGGEVLSNPAAIALYQRYGQNLGTFKNEALADAYAQLLHRHQAAWYNKH